MSLPSVRLCLLFGLGLLLPGAAQAQGISIDGDSLGFGLDEPAEKTPAVCWVAPKKLRRADAKRLRESLKIAFEVTRPDGSRHQLKPVRSPKRQGRKLGCDVYVRVSVRGRRQAKITLKLMDKRYKRTLKQASVSGALAKVNGVLLESPWQQLWPLIIGATGGEAALVAAKAPPAAAPVAGTAGATAPAAGAAAPVAQIVDKPSDLPPAGSEPAKKSGRFVDQELIDAQSKAKVEAAAATALPPPPMVGLLVGGGYTSRSLSGVPGLTRSSNSLVSVWGEAQLYVGALALPAEHELNLELNYAKRFASVKNDTKSGSATADRLSVTGRYHYVTPVGARLGVMAGHEYLRFNVPADLDAFESRYSVIRFGLSGAMQVLKLGPRAGLDITLEGGARAPIGADEVSFGLDARLGFALRLDSGLLGALRLRYLRQPGKLPTFSYTEQNIDVELGAGWSF